MLAEAAIPNTIPKLSMVEHAAPDLDSLKNDAINDPRLSARYSPWDTILDMHGLAVRHPSMLVKTSKSEENRATNTVLKLAITAMILMQAATERMNV